MSRPPATAGQPVRDKSAGKWAFLSDLDARLAATAVPQKTFLEFLRLGDDELASRFQDGEQVSALVHDRARLVDALVVSAWQRHFGSDADELALVAVGGYGRGELHPGSDIDLLILSPEGTDFADDSLKNFLAFLWDIGLEPGHSVRTVKQCVEVAADDITVATALMESRLLFGAMSLFEEMRGETGPAGVWPSRDFFAAKLAEQERRHHRYHDTAYNLEPNIKSGPGGLRDIQMIGWVAKRHFKVDDLQQLVALGFLTTGEYRRLRAGQAYLWRVRFALHMLTGRREDRLLFDYQMQLAKQFGYSDSLQNLAVEKFMQRYYRMVMRLSRLNEMLLQFFQEAILLQPDPQPKVINPRFQSRNGYLEASSADVFVNQPSALLEIFQILQQQTGLRGVGATTIRLIRRNLRLVDVGFRADPAHRKLFMDIIRAPAGVTHELRRMNDYGILGRYIPAFGRIVGRMQYDLFHVYTVDAHTLFVVSNLRRFALNRYDHEFPDCSRIMQSLEHPEIVYLAGLFHDIAKGRGGDHSMLGAEEAEAFCTAHGMGEFQSQLVAWLVCHHLLLSVTSQKKDISDPAVIHQFARQVEDQLHLDFLYVLTIADVRGTNPKLWNSWKASLFREFYLRVSQALRAGLETPQDQEELVAGHRREALAILRDLDNIHLTEDSTPLPWDLLGEEYFLRHSPAEIAWHTSVLLAAGDNDSLVTAVGENEMRGGTPLLVRATRRQESFALATAALDDMGLNIVDAVISPAGGDGTLDSYLVLDYDGKALTDAHRRQEVASRLRRVLSSDRTTPRVSRKAPRQVRLFSTPTELRFSANHRGDGTIMELTTGDRPGLLSEVAQSLQAVGAHIRTAKIMTIGERAEDVFYITSIGGGPLSEEKQEQLKQRLTTVLDRH
ncbi:MAG: [protein-PII] uridylyltransferase [Gammaproteobacteria bacterium]|nr:[protein-PII] uridylyltransferase [Gammaproteobacteria bacterium]